MLPIDRLHSWHGAPPVLIFMGAQRTRRRYRPSFRRAALGVAFVTAGRSPRRARDAQPARLLVPGSAPGSRSHHPHGNTTTSR
jgi:hypothetical protein